MSQARLNVVRAMAAMAWSDGRMDKKEKEQLRLLAKRVLPDPSDQSRVEGFLMSRPSMEGVTFDDLNDKERQALFLLAAHYAYMDGQCRPGEKQVLDQLGTLLGLDTATQAAVEAQVKAQKSK
jgi:uncharacterized membrane protein YebE (DUF533 family)